MKEYYYLDGYKIYNSKSKKYIKGDNFKYKLKNNNDKYISITMKEIYRRLFNEVFCIDNIQLLRNEQFKKIVGTNGNYEVSNLGRIKSKAGNHAIILKTQITKKGYERVQLSINGKKYDKFVHSLVAMTWLEIPPILDLEVHHIDGNKLNNTVSNLQFLSKLDHLKLHNKL